jgi:hypothetical protein
MFSDVNIPCSAIIAAVAAISLTFKSDKEDVRTKLARVDWM